MGKAGGGKTVALGEIAGVQEGGRGRKEGGRDVGVGKEGIARGGW